MLCVWMVAIRMGLGERVAGCVLYCERASGVLLGYPWTNILLLYILQEDSDDEDYALQQQQAQQQQQQAQLNIRQESLAASGSFGRGLSGLKGALAVIGAFKRNSTGDNVLYGSGAQSSNGRSGRR